MKRRTFVEGIGAMSLGAMAGCLHSDDEEAEYTRWAGESMSDEMLTIGALRPAEMSDIEGLLEEDDGALGIQVEELDYLQSISWESSGEFLFILRTDVDTESVVDGVETQYEDFGVTMEESDPYGDFTVYESEDGEVQLGFDGDTIVHTVWRNRFETAIDAEAGDVDRLIDTDERFELASSEVGDDHLASFHLGESLGERALGYGGEFSEGESELSYVIVESDGDAAADNEQSYRDIIESYDATVEDSSIDGRTLTMTVSIPTDAEIGEPIAEELVAFLNGE